MNRKKRDNSKIWAVIAGGGTAGHIFPGLAVAEELKNRGNSVRLVGSKRGLESEMVQGQEISLLKGRGFRRSLKPASIFSNILAVKELISSFFVARRLLKKLHPRVVMGTGGYASVPVGIAAFTLKIPLVILESNSTAGMANRVLSRVAKASAVAFAECRLRRSVFTGNPVRGSIERVNRNKERKNARATLGIAEERFLIVSMGGSLGARSLNKITEEMLHLWQNQEEGRNLTVFHITGKNTRQQKADEGKSAQNGIDKKQTKKQVQEKIHYESMEFFQDMHLLYAAADIFICRAGALSIAELAITGTPSILVPLPGSAGNHQEKNAKTAAAAGAALLCLEENLNAESLKSCLLELMQNPKALKAMSKSAEKLSVRDSSKAVADLLEAHAND